MADSIPWSGFQVLSSMAEPTKAVEAMRCTLQAVHEQVQEQNGPFALRPELELDVIQVRGAPSSLLLRTAGLWFSCWAKCMYEQFLDGFAVAQCP
jgi:hypothetical protein